MSHTSPHPLPPSGHPHPGLVDLVIVGAGPCGIAAGAAARAAGLSVLLFDRGAVTDSLVGYPPYMTFFSTADKLEIAGIPFPVPSSRPTRLDALTYYRGVVRHFDLPVRQFEPIREIVPLGATGRPPSEGRFLLRSEARGGILRETRAHDVVIATGSFDHPNLLGIPGESLPKVMHRYTEPHPYFRERVLIVGGSNSAVEAALELWRAGASVTLVHFAGELDRGVKPWVRPDIENRIRNGEIAVRWHSRLRAVEETAVEIVSEATGEVERLENDWVFALTGWVPDRSLLRATGVRVDPDTGVPHHDPTTMESDVAGVYIAGVLAAGNDANRIFIENGREHGERIVSAILSRNRATEDKREERGDAAGPTTKAPRGDPSA